jgi:hypothetical protein
MKRFQNKNDNPDALDFVNEADELLTFFNEEPSSIDKNQSTKENQKSQNNKSENLDERFSPIVRLGATENISRWALRDEDGDLIYSDEGKGIYLPAGSRVVKLSSNPKNKNYTHIIVWYNMNYLEGYIHNSALTNDASDENLHQYSKELFINDAWHIISLTRSIINELQEYYTDKMLSEAKIQFGPFDKMLSSIENRLNQIETGELQLTNEMLVKLDSEFTEGFETLEGDKVATVNKIADIIFSILNPESKYSENKRTSEDTMIFPISKNWFNDSPLMKEYYSNQFPAEIKDTFIGSSGEGISINHPDFDFKLLLNQILELKYFVESNESQIKDSSEKKWLMELSTEEVSNTKLMIFFSENSWELTSKNMWADLVPMDQSLGNIESNRLLSILIHELNVNADLLSVEDSHIFDEKAAFEMAKSGQFNKVLDSAIDIKSLFQLSPSISAFYLAYYLDRIEEMQ